MKKFMAGCCVILLTPLLFFFIGGNGKKVRTRIAAGRRKKPTTGRSRESKEKILSGFPPSVVGFHLAVVDGADVSRIVGTALPEQIPTSPLPYVGLASDLLLCQL